MDCVLLAGCSPAGGTMQLYTQGRPRAVIDMGGRAMIERFGEALPGSRSGEDIVIVGLGQVERSACGCKRPGR